MRLLPKHISECVNEFLKDFPMFKRVMSRKENGDVCEETKELTFDEKIDASLIGTSPDAFADAVDRIPDVSLVDRFDAIAQLNAAIAGIQFAPENENEDEK